MGSQISVSDTININNTSVIKVTKEHKPPTLTYEMLMRFIPRSIESDFINKTLSSYDILARIKQDPSTFSLPQYDKVCFICCNSYERTRYLLGEPAVNDGILSYIKLEQLGYKVFLFHDILKAQFMSLFKTFLNAKASHVCIYYIGHGTYTYDTSGDEADHNDECLFFTDGTIVDDELYKAILKHKNKDSLLLLLTDCCHSGTMYDVPDRADIISISAANDNQTAKQDWIERRGQGIFTYYLWKYYNSSITLAELEAKMNKKLNIYTQTFNTNRQNMKDVLKGFL